MPDEDHYQWRETYFIWFDSKRRPPLKHVEDLVRHLRGHFELSGGEADDEGLIQALTVRSSEDHAALEIECEAGPEVREEATNMATELRPSDCTDPGKLKLLEKCDARFEIMHFEEVVDSIVDDEPDEMFDPSALLVVLEGLVKATDGICVDPQSGIIM